MSLGETIYRLRTEKNLSQGELAERLEVSRQSVSKWENNSAVPDLEKIIKLGEIFEVSLDELVKGEATPRKIVAVTEVKAKETGFPPRKIGGTILLCMAFLVVILCAVAGGILEGMILALPFLTCGILCFALKKNVGLWCAWDIYVLFDFYMTYATGISRSSVWLTFRWTQQMNYMRLAFAWVLVLSLAGMIAATVVRFGKVPFASEEKGKSRLLVSWAVLVLIQVAAMIWVRTAWYQYIIENIFELAVVYQFITVAFSWSRIIAFTVALTATARFIKMKKQE